MDTSDSIRRAQPLLGTFVEITAAGAAQSDMERAIESAFAAVAQVHRLMSFHDPNSDVSRLNRDASGRAVRVHPWTFQVLTAALDIYRRSNGAFDITVAPVLQRMGRLPRDENTLSFAAISMGAREVIELLPDHCVCFRDQSVKIDLGGIAKGFAVDHAIDSLRAHGMPCGVVNAGGDLAAYGPMPEAVYVRNPRYPDRLLCRVEVNDQAIASSGGRIDAIQCSDTTASAVIDPSSQELVRAIAGATVRASSCMIADALTKVIMVAGEQANALLKHYRANALFVSADGDTRVTSDWQDSVHFAA